MLGGLLLTLCHDIKSSHYSTKKEGERATSFFFEHVKLRHEAVDNMPDLLSK